MTEPRFTYKTARDFQCGADREVYLALSPRQRQHFHELQASYAQMVLSQGGTEDAARVRPGLAALVASGLR